MLKHRRHLLAWMWLLALATTVSRAAEPRFTVHTIHSNVALVDDSVMACTLVDLDRDGDLDWTVGTIWPRYWRSRQLYWYEHRAADDWVRHWIGTDAEMYGGACTVDVDADGQEDLITTNLWQRTAAGEWRLTRTGIGDGAHDLQAVDVNGDGKQDVVAFTQGDGLSWFEPPSNLQDLWMRHPIAPADFAGTQVHANASPRGAADLDGDGDIDIAVVFGWFENRDGQGVKWNYRRHDLFPSHRAERFPWGFAVKTETGDIDRDGDMDIVYSECDTAEAVGIVWMENVDGRGTFAMHWIQPRVHEDFHSLALLDYDQDGDLDLLSATGPLATAPEKFLYLFENLGAGQGLPIYWKKHRVHQGMPIHEARVGDVDTDGDIDLVIKPWNRKDSPKDFLYLENLLMPQPKP